MRRVPCIHSSTSALLLSPLIYLGSAPGYSARICQSSSVIRCILKVTRGLPIPTTMRRPAQAASQIGAGLFKLAPSQTGQCPNSGPFVLIEFRRCSAPFPAKKDRLYESVQDYGHGPRSGAPSASIGRHRKTLETLTNSPKPLSASVRPARRELTMSFDLGNNDTCPKCRKPFGQTTIERHPTRADLAIHNSQCPNCGAVKTRILFAKPDKAIA